MSIFTRGTHTVAPRLGGEGWDFTPGAADNLAAAQIEILDGPNCEAAADAPSPATDDGSGQDHPETTSSDD